MMRCPTEERISEHFQSSHQSEQTHPVGEQDILMTDYTSDYRPILLEKYSCQTYCSVLEPNHPQSEETLPLGDCERNTGS